MCVPLRALLLLHGSSSELVKVVTGTGFLVCVFFFRFVSCVVFFFFF